MVRALEFSLSFPEWWCGVDGTGGFFGRFWMLNNIGAHANCSGSCFFFSTSALLLEVSPHSTPVPGTVRDAPVYYFCFFWVCFCSCTFFSVYCWQTVIASFCLCFSSSSSISGFVFVCVLDEIFEYVDLCFYSLRSPFVGIFVSGKCFPSTILNDGLQLLEWKLKMFPS